jgi:hypothetical protein
VDTGFRKGSCSNKKLERDDDSKKSHRALGLEPLQLGDGTGVFDEILRAGVDRGLQRRPGVGSVAAQQVPFADVELGLAFFLRLARGGAHLRERAPIEIEVDHRVGPVLALEPRGVGAELGGAVLLEAPAREVAPQHRVGVVLEIVGAQQVRGRGAEAPM